jgi:glutamine amidotransferase-like uncharacterized protein
MKYYHSLLLAVLCVALSGCNADREPALPGDGAFQATIEAQKSASRTSLSGTTVLWSAGDTIAVYRADILPDGLGVKFGLLAEDAGSAHGRFVSTEHPDWSAYTCNALFPASMDGGLDGKTLTVNLPEVQVYRKGSFGPSQSPAVAVNGCNGVMSFKNLCGVMAVKVTAAEAITEVRLTTLAEEALWGPATVSLDYTDAPSLVMAAPAFPEQKTVIMKVDENVSEGQVIDPGTTYNVNGSSFAGAAAESMTMYFVVPAGTLAQGFMVTVFTAEGKYMQKYAVASAANATARSVITEMPNVDFADQSEVEIRTDVMNKAFYKDLFLDAGIGLNDKFFVGVADKDHLNLTYEKFAGKTNNATIQAAQNEAFCSNANDENGVLLYPDGEPRYRMVYVNGGVSATHGVSLMAQGRDHFQQFVNNGGSYLGSCAGAYVASYGVIEAGITTTNSPMMSYNGYMGLWPGLCDNTGITDVYPDYTVPEDSPLLKYDNFGGDLRIDSIKQYNGPYFSRFDEVPGTEVLARFDYPAYRCHTHPSIISYKPSSWRGRVTITGGHPEQATEGEGLDLMIALMKYSLDGMGPAKVKAVLRNGEIRQMTKSTSDNDPDHAKVGDKQCHNFVFGLPEGAKNIRIRLEVKEDFNVSLRLAKGTFAFKEDAQYSVENGNLVKELTFDTLGKGTWYIGVQCEDTVVNDINSTYGLSYSGKLAALNGAPYTIQVSWE